MSTASASVCEVAHDGVGVQLRHPRRADHHRRRAGGLRVPRVARCRSASPRPSCPATTGTRPVDVADHDLEHARALVVVQARDLARDAERGEAVDAVAR